MRIGLALRSAAAVLGVVALALIPAAPAAASCVVWGSEAEMLADADVAFVGTVATVTNQERWATVNVEEIWQGPDLPAIVEVRGGPEPGVGSSVDRQYVAGMRYLFAVGIVEGTLHDTSCSMTAAWTDDLLRFRPPAPRAAVRPVDTRTGESGVDWLPMLAAGLVVVAGGAIFGGVLVVRSRRHEP